MASVLTAPLTPFRVVLISPYELGRQPFALAHPAAHLEQAGCAVTLVDLSQQKLDAAVLARADVIGLYLGMHTAARIALEALPRLREIAPQAHLCAYGLYAPENAEALIALGVGQTFDGEFEEDLRAWCLSLRDHATFEPRHRTVFLKPVRSGLPSLQRYAHLQMPDGSERVVGFAEASRGCKHLCRHCPVVPVYQGRFRAIPLDIVMADIAQQVAAGAQHISFGDADFLNGPTHARRLIERLQREFPGISFDCTIKIEHLLEHREMLPALAQSGCLFITTAVESVDDNVLMLLKKGHTAADFEHAVALTRQYGITLAPTFVPFTPWTSADSYLELLRRIVALDLVAHVAPVQLTIRLLVPRGSALFDIPGFASLVGAFDERLFGYPWKNPDPRVDQLQLELQRLVASLEKAPRNEVFLQIWQAAHVAFGLVAPPLVLAETPAPAQLSEPWYCCAEPTAQQLQAF